MLREVRAYLADRGPCTLQQVAGHLDIEPSVAEGMLAVLVRRGEISQQRLSDFCGKCSGGCSGACGLQDMTLYAVKARA
jgi:predicted ArsR family transcriptional regulator